MTQARLHIALAALISLAPMHCGAQISLASAVNLALKNSPKVRGAKADVDKARASLSEVRDAYIPVVSTQAGYGQSTGAPLNVPVIFSISAQSLVFSFSQRDYTRSAKEGLNAAELSLHNTEVDVVEDTTNTYLALDFAIERQRVLQESLGIANRLVSVTTDRIAVGVEAPVALPRSRRTATQMRLLALGVEDDIAAHRQHLAQLTGLPAPAITTVRSSIPQISAVASTFATVSADDPDSDGIRAAFATAKAKQYTAFGDRRYMFRPQISLAANYSRVATFLSSYASYYPRYGGTTDNPNSQNSYGFGLEFGIPLLDMAHRAKARVSAAEAARAFADADQQRGLYREGKAKLSNAARELDLRAQLARDDREIAQDELETIRVRLQSAADSGNGPQLTPADQLNAQLQERQKYLDVLAADLQLQQTQVNLLRQTDGLGQWVLGAAATTTPSQTIVPGSPVTPAAAPLAPPVNPLPAAPSAIPRP